MKTINLRYKITGIGELKRFRSELEKLASVARKIGLSGKDLRKYVIRKLDKK